MLNVSTWREHWSAKLALKGWHRHSHFSPGGLAKTWWLTKTLSQWLIWHLAV